MPVSAIIPVKSLRDVKSRLSDVLPPEAREQLTVWLTGHVVRTVHDSGCVDRVYVITPDLAVLAHVRQWGATPLLQHGAGLNAALEEATTRARDEGASACLTIFGDLPLLSSADVASMIRLGRARSQAVVAAPDRHGRGTNALLARPAGVMPYMFGVDSYPAYETAARDARLLFETYRSPGTGTDVDTPEDLAVLREMYPDLELLRLLNGSVTGGAADAACRA